MSECMMLDEAGDGMAESGEAAQPLAGLVAARLCHDLSGLLGTLLGAIEMTLDETNKPGEALLLADDAARELGFRLRLLRAAWAGDGSIMDADGLLALTPGLPAARRVTLDVSGLVGRFPAPVGRLLLNLVVLGAEALPGGGSIVLQGRWPERIELTAAGPRILQPPALAGCLAGLPPPPGGPREIQVPMTFAAAAAAGARIIPMEASGPGLMLAVTGES